MRIGLVALSLVLLMGVIQGIGCSHDPSGELDLGVDVDADSDAGIGDLGDVDLFDNDSFVPFPDPDGGIVITLDGGVPYKCYIAPCQGKVYACGNCLDDDNDGLPDSLDPDCLGPCQNSESGFFGEIPGQNNAPCKSDCYWDQDTGPGNDNCYWSHSCDPNEANAPLATMPEIGCSYDPNTNVAGAPVPPMEKDCSYLLANQSAECKSYCGPLTPSGCDCFGCCEDPNRPGNFVFAGSVDDLKQPTCNSDPATLANPSLCKPCQPVNGGPNSCYKSCAKCQLCFGKTTLPAECYTSSGDGGTGGDGGSGDGGTIINPPQICPGGQTPCGLLGQEPCAPGFYCISGCCTALIF